MARKRDPKRDEALKIFIERNGEVSNRELASLLSVPEKTISAWKSRDKWNEVLRKNDCSTAKNECSTTNKGGAPKGNKNAVGNKGNSRASPPTNNKNAVKTGEYETIFADQLSDEEKEIYSTLSDDPSFILSEEIRILKIRQRRMMRRIKEAEVGLNQKEIEQLEELRGRKQYVESEKGGKKVAIEIPAMIVTERKERIVRKIEDILSIEDALTRISTQLTRAVKQLGEAVMADQRLELMKAQTDHTKAQTTKALINKDGDENDGGTVINIIDDIG